MICFCRCGTSSSGQSMPRSPRATMTASAAAAMPGEVGERRARSRSWRRCRRGRRRPRAARATSAARRTNDRATNSTPARGDGLGQLEVAIGRREHLQPLAREVDARRALRAAAALHLGDDRVGLRRRHQQRDVAVADDDAVTGVDVVEQRRVVDGDHARRCSAGPGHEPHRRGRHEVDAAVGEPARRGAWDPGRSASTPIGRPTCSATDADRRAGGRGARRSCRG